MCHRGTLDRQSGLTQTTFLSPEARQGGDRALGSCSAVQGLKCHCYSPALHPLSLALLMRG